jgi:hypothetical protein
MAKSIRIVILRKRAKIKLSQRWNEAEAEGHMISRGPDSIFICFGNSSTLYKIHIFML